jgi:sugar/nucleoside kinase (ribokinase family)
MAPAAERPKEYGRYLREYGSGMTTVTCVGLAVLDLVFSVDVRPDRGRKTFADSMTVIGGGPAANAAVAVTRLNGDARFIGRLGDDNHRRTTPAFDVDTVDTLGAGDVFHGAFALGLAEQRPVEEVIRRASAVAALKCTRFGGRAGIPCSEDVDDFMRGSPGQRHRT